jgi:hypothetical protein
VSEYGSQPYGAGGQLSLFQPKPARSTPTASANFQSRSIDRPVPGYLADYGQAFNTTRGHGWVTESDPPAPYSIVGDGRDRNLQSNELLDTLMHMQHTGKGGIPGPARWEIAVPNGTYDITVYVGDPAYIDSVDRLTINGVLAIPDFVPTNADHFDHNTIRVEVTGGVLIYDAVGGSNTKIDFTTITT